MQLIQLIDADVVCLQEVFDPWVIQQAQQVVNYPYYVIDANVLNSSLFFGSGLAVLSKHPIQQYSFYPFTESKGTDRFSSKGWLVVELEQAIIVNVHLQASDEHAAVRHHQWNQIWSWWIRTKWFQATDVTKPVWFAGDWNMTEKEWKQLKHDFPELDWIQCTSHGPTTMAPWMPYDAILWSKRQQTARLQSLDQSKQASVRALNHFLQSSDHDPLFATLSARR